MQRAKQLLFFASLLTTALFSCKNDAPITKETAAQIDTIRVAPIPKEGSVTFVITSGTVYWVGKKALGGPHYGTINVDGGELRVNDGRLFAGKISLDMQSVTVSDLEDGGEKRELEAHLKDKDFFEVKKFPKAEFNIDEVLPSTMPAFNSVVVGTLTIFLTGLLISRFRTRAVAKQ